MGITVAEALKLEGLDKATVVAGGSGLDRVIKRVSVIECPEWEEYPEVLREGDFFLTSLYAFKDDEAVQLEMMRTLVEFQSSGLCIIDLYMNDVSTVMKKFADEVSYPVMLLPNNVPYGDIITNVMDAIIQNKDDTIRAMKIDSMLQSGKTPKEIKQIAYDLNSQFRENIIALFYKDSAQDTRAKVKTLKSEFRAHSSWTVLKYQDGILLILSFDAMSRSNVLLWLNELKKRLLALDPECQLGVSNLHSGREYMNLAVKEALLAVDVGRKLFGKRDVYYKDLGLYKLLMPLRNEPELRRFHEEIMGPIMQYDEKHKTKLLQTAIAYVENDGDLKRTAKALFQHVNTIRYRLKKIKGILGMEDYEGTFYEQLAVGLKIHKMLW